MCNQCCDRTQTDLHHTVLKGAKHKSTKPSEQTNRQIRNEQDIPRQLVLGNAIPSLGLQQGRVILRPSRVRVTVHTNIDIGHFIRIVNDIIDLSDKPIEKLWQAWHTLGREEGTQPSENLHNSGE